MSFQLASILCYVSGNENPDSKCNHKSLLRYNPNDMTSWKVILMFSFEAFPVAIEKENK